MPCAQIRQITVLAGLFPVILSNNLFAGSSSGIWGDELAGEGAGEEEGRERGNLPPGFGQSQL
jgi:hypothetical protein